MMKMYTENDKEGTFMVCVYSHVSKRGPGNLRELLCHCWVIGPGIVLRMRSLRTQTPPL